MKETVHTGNSGIERCKQCVRDTLYWPGINAHLEDYVASCTTCMEYRIQQQKGKPYPSSHSLRSEVENRHRPVYSTQHRLSNNRLLQH